MRFRCRFCALTGEGRRSGAGIQARRDAGRIFEFPKIAGDGADKTYADPAYPIPKALAAFNFDDLRRLGFDHMRVPLISAR